MVAQETTLITDNGQSYCNVYHLSYFSASLNCIGVALLKAYWGVREMVWNSKRRHKSEHTNEATVLSVSNN